MTLLAALALAILSAPARAEPAPAPGTGAETWAEIARDPQWRRLMRYRPRWISGVKSEVDGSGYFFHPDGRTDPAGEAAASWAAFTDPASPPRGTLAQPPRCAFPERYRYLREKLAPTLGSALPRELGDADCPKLAEFMSRFRARGVTLVFSSAYPNNPASMFGHSLFRIDAEAPGARDGGGTQARRELLEWGINFAAMVSDDENGVAFAWNGMVGGYQGQFAAVPYYTKVNEYNAAESRDLWEYELSLDAAKTRRLLNHLWELETNSYFDYFFFDENCAYHLNALLEVIEPGWVLTTGFPLYAIPSDAVRKVTHTPGAVVGLRFRPSLRAKMERKLRALESLRGEAGTDAVKALLRFERAPETERDPLVLESATAWLAYLKRRGEGLSEAQTSLARALLVQRSKVPDASPLPDPEGAITEDEARAMDFPVSTRPDRGHGSRRFAIRQGRRGDAGYFGLEIKTAYHDLLNRDVGFVPFSQVDFPSVQLRWSPATGGIRLHEVDLLKIVSLPPSTFVERPWAWKFNAAYAPLSDTACPDCRGFQLRSAAGWAFQARSRDGAVEARPYLLGGLDLGAATALERILRAGPAVETGVVVRFGELWKIHADAELVGDVGQAWRPWLHGRASVRAAFAGGEDWDVRLGLERFVGAGALSELELAGNFYF